MKKVGVGVVIGALLFALAGFTYSATRPTAVTPAQLNALKKRVTKLEKITGALATYTASCLLSWQGITQYGKATGEGYVYQTPSGQGLTTAVDYTESGQTPEGWVPFTHTQQCTAPTGSVRAALRAAGVRLVVAHKAQGHRISH
jgi:hypothetical protein